MTIEGVARCEGVDGCGSWIMLKALSCPCCEISKDREKGISDAETNQRRADMVGASETEKGDR